jgi:hypothetical protein
MFDNAFYQFNYNGALTQLPDGSFNTSRLTAIPEKAFASFNEGGKLTTLPDGSFDLSSCTRLDANAFNRFNAGGSIECLPSSAFDTGKVTIFGSNVFADFNNGGAIKQSGTYTNLRFIVSNTGTIPIHYFVNGSNQTVVSATKASFFHKSRGVFVDDRDVLLGIKQTVAGVATDLMTEISDVANAVDTAVDTMGDSITSNYTTALSALDAKHVELNDDLDSKYNTYYGALADSINELDAKSDANDDAFDKQLAATKTTLSSHTTNTSNPHQVSKADVGLGNVTNVNTADATNITSGTLSEQRLPNITVAKATTAAYDDKARTDTVGNLFQWLINLIKGLITRVTSHDTSLSTLTNMASATDSALTEHINDASNPHSVTSNQVGLGNVVNVDQTNASNITSGTLALGRLPNVTYAVSINGSINSALDSKTSGSTVGPISIQTAISDIPNWLKGINLRTLDHIANTNNPHSVTAAQLNLDNVSNVDTTNADNITSGTLSADRLPNQSITLSTPNVPANAPGTIPANSINAQVTDLYEQDWYLTDTIDSHLSDGANPHGVTKSQVGLSNVPNVDTTNASNIASGTLAAGRLPNVTVAPGTATDYDNASRTDTIGNLLQWLVNLIKKVIANVSSNTSAISANTSTISSNTAAISDNATAISNVSDFADGLDARMRTHISDADNPHSVTKLQVGLGAVPNIDFTTVAFVEGDNGEQVYAGDINYSHLPEIIVGDTLNGTDPAFVADTNTTHDYYVIDWISKFLQWIKWIYLKYKSHANNTSNPHQVTAEQVGLGNVINIDTTNASNISSGTLSEGQLPKLTIASTAEKSVPVGTAARLGTLNELFQWLRIGINTVTATVTSHTTSYTNPHKVTAAQIDLGNVDNTTDANKPVSTATQTALDTKVDKVTGKGLSTNDLTDALVTTIGTALQSESDPTVGSHIKAITTTDIANWNSSNGMTSANDAAIKLTLPAAIGNFAFTANQSTAVNVDASSLATQAFVNSSIEAMAANQVFSSAIKGLWSTAAALKAATTYYNHSGTAYTPSNRDYAIVVADESAPSPYTGGQTRWVYEDDEFVYQYGLNESLTQSQTDALNSGVTSTVVSKVNNLTFGETTTGSGNVVTAVAIDTEGDLTVTKGITALTSHQDISGKVDKINRSAASSGLYKFAVNAQGQVTTNVAVAKADITALGIPGSDTTYSALPNPNALSLSKDGGTATTYTGSAAVSFNVKQTYTKSDVGLGNVSNIDTTSASNISSGTLAEGRLPSLTISANIANTTEVGTTARTDTINNLFQWLRVGINTVAYNLSAHISNVTNPHGVTKSQIGLGNVANVDTTNASNIASGIIDASRLPSISIAASENKALTGTAAKSGTIGALIQWLREGITFVNSSFSSHLAATNNPHSVTATQVGLGNVSNTDTTNASNISSGTLNVSRLPNITVAADSSTSDIGTALLGPASIATLIQALRKGINYVKSLVATNTSAIGSLTSTVNDNATSLAATEEIVNNHVYDTGNPHGVTKAQIGLGNVANVDSTNISNVTSGTLAEGRLPTLTIAVSTNTADVGTGAQQGKQITALIQWLREGINYVKSLVATNTGAIATNTGAIAAISSVLAPAIIKIDTVEAKADTHIGRTDNPHSVTKAQVGLGNVPNTDTTDASNITSGTLSYSRLANVAFTIENIGVGLPSNPYDVGQTGTITNTLSNLLRLAHNYIKYIWVLFNEHTSYTNNPHSVTATQVGLGKVSNTDWTTAATSTDTAMISIGRLPSFSVTLVQGGTDPEFADATYTSSTNTINGWIRTISRSMQYIYLWFKSHIANTNNPHAVTKAQIGLNNVPNIDLTVATTYSDQTTIAYTRLPEIIIYQHAKGDPIGYYDDKLEDDSSTQSFNRPIHDAFAAAFGYIKWLNLKVRDHLSATNPHGVTASQIGLGNVNNTSDVNKPISTATKSYIDNKMYMATSSDAAASYSVSHPGILTFY